MAFIQCYFTSAWSKNTSWKWTVYSSITKAYLGKKWSISDQRSSMILVILIVTMVMMNEAQPHESSYTLMLYVHPPLWTLTDHGCPGPSALYFIIQYMVCGTKSINWDQTPIHCVLREGLMPWIGHVFTMSYVLVRVYHSANCLILLSWFIV